MIRLGKCLVCGETAKGYIDSWNGLIETCMDTCCSDAIYTKAMVSQCKRGLVGYYKFRTSSLCKNIVVARTGGQYSIGEILHKTNYNWLKKSLEYLDVNRLNESDELVLYVRLEFYDEKHSSIRIAREKQRYSEDDDERKIFSMKRVRFSDIAKYNFHMPCIDVNCVYGDVASIPIKSIRTEYENIAFRVKKYTILKNRAIKMLLIDYYKKDTCLVKLPQQLLNMVINSYYTD